MVGSAAAAPPPPPPPPPVAAEVADVPNTRSVAAEEATMRSTFTELMNRIDDMKMGLQDVKDDLCEFYHVYVDEFDEQTALPVQTRVSPRSSSAGSLVQTALPQEAQQLCRRHQQLWRRLQLSRRLRDLDLAFEGECGTVKVVT